MFLSIEMLELMLERDVTEFNIWSIQRSFNAWVHWVTTKPTSKIKILCFKRKIKKSKPTYKVKINDTWNGNIVCSLAKPR